MEKSQYRLNVFWERKFSSGGTYSVEQGTYGFWKGDVSVPEGREGERDVSTED
jgi:hypothetical protein